MRGLSVLASAFFCIASATSAQESLGQKLQDCLLFNVIQFEPHMDNMLDLAEILLSTECIAERDALMTATGIAQLPDRLLTYQNQMRPNVQAMVVAVRANRLGINRK